MGSEDSTDLLYTFGFTDLVTKLGKKSDTVYVVRPGRDLAIETIEGVFRDPPSEILDKDRPIRLLIRDSDFIGDTFRPCRQGVELIETDLMEIRQIDSLEFSAPLIASSKGIYLLPRLGDALTLFSPSREKDGRVAMNNVDRLWKEGTEVDLEGPAWFQVMRSLGEETSEETKETFVELLDARQEASQDSRVHVVRLFLLAGARTNTTQKALSKWARENNVASQGTLSKCKEWLFKEDIIGERKVAAGHPGRPLQLYIKDEDLGEAPIDELYEHVARMIRQSGARR